tara:strand:+ start:3989 stop:4567 length:579 start_codon:yes stop_codon:yes gene_type:complete
MFTAAATPAHTAALTLTALIALLALARTYAYPPPPPSLNPLGLRGATADTDITQMFDVDPALLTCLKRSLASTETQVVLIDNDQLSGTKARELSGRLARNRHMYAFGVGRRLSPMLVLTHSQRYHHVSCQKTKDAADATMLLLAMRLWCLCAGLHCGAWARLGLCVVSRDRVFEQLRASFALCNMDVLLEAS